MERLQFLLKRRLSIFAQFEEDQRLISPLDLVLPSVNRFEAGENVCAGSELSHDEFIRNPPSRFGIGERAEREQNFYSHPLNDFGLIACVLFISAGWVGFSENDVIANGANIRRQGRGFSALRATRSTFSLHCARSGRSNHRRERHHHRHKTLRLVLASQRAVVRANERERDYSPTE